MCRLSAVGSNPQYTVIRPALTRFVNSCVSVQSASKPRHCNSSRMFIAGRIDGYRAFSNCQLRRGSGQGVSEHYHLPPVAQIRNPRPEIRRKSEFRSPNHPPPGHDSSPPTEGLLLPSGFGLPSDFGFRTSRFRASGFGAAPIGRTLEQPRPPASSPILSLRKPSRAQYIGASAPFHRLCGSDRFAERNGEENTRITLVPMKLSRQSGTGSGRADRQCPCECGHGRHVSQTTRGTLYP